jgi:hypothetical protein
MPKIKKDRTALAATRGITKATLADGEYKEGRKKYAASTRRHEGVSQKIWET